MSYLEEANTSIFPCAFGIMSENSLPLTSMVFFFFSPKNYRLLCSTFKSRIYVMLIVKQAEGFGGGGCCLVLLACGCPVVLAPSLERLSFL